MAFGDVVQSVDGADPTTTLPGAPTVGNTLIWVKACRSGSPFAPTTGTWTLIRTEVMSQNVAGDGPVSVYYRPVIVGDTAAFASHVFSAGDKGKLIEVAGVLVLDDHDGLSAQNNVDDLLTLNPTAGVKGFLLSVATIASDGVQPGGFTPASGMTELVDTGPPAPQLAINHRKITTTAGSYVVGSTWAHNIYANSAVIGISFVEAPPAPAPGVSVDFDNDGVLLGDYDDVSADVVSWVISRGASAEITGGAQPGGATIVLRRKQRDGRYNPWYAAGPLYGLLRDGLRVWIGVNNDGTMGTPGTVKGLFAGRVTDITPLQSAGSSHVPHTEIVCEDPLSWYGRTNVKIPDSRRRSHRDLRLAVLQDIGETRYSLDNEIGTMPLSSAEGDGFGVLQRINAANGTRHFAKPSDSAFDWYRYTTYNRQHKLAGVADASLDAGAKHVTETSGWRLSADTVINQQTATVEQVRFPDRKITVWQPDAVPITVTTVTQTFWASFDDYVDGAELDISSTGSVLSTSFTAFGRSAKITLTSAGTSKVTRFLVVGHLVERGTAVSVVIDDTASQAGPRGVRAGQDISGDYVGVRAMADGIARHLVWRYGSPQMRPTLTVHNWFPQQFELDLFDIISFTAGQFAATAVLFEIVGLTHVSDVASTAVQHHTTTYVLQQCRVQAATAWFVLNSSLLNSTDILAY